MRSTVVGGTERSTNPPADVSSYDLLWYVADLDAMRKNVDVEQVHILGHSWGGIVAMRSQMGVRDSP